MPTKVKKPCDSALDHQEPGVYIDYGLGGRVESKSREPKKDLMTKRDLVIRISNETGLVQQQVLDVVQKALDYIAEAVAKGEKIELRNFGVFEVKIRKARVGRNPNQPGTDVPIPQRAVVKFKPGKDMREHVLKLTPMQGQGSSSNPNPNSNPAP